MSDPTIERNSCIEYLGNLLEKQLNFKYHITEVFKKLAEHYSLISR